MIDGFADELEKVAKYKAVTKLMRKFKQTDAGKSATGKKVRAAVARFQRSPEYRSAVARGAGGGALAGGAAGVAGGDKDDSAVSRFLRGAAGGALLGGAAGGLRPGALTGRGLTGPRSRIAKGERVARLDGRQARRRDTK